MVQPGPAASQVWDILIREPLTGVAILDERGQRLWVNDQAVQIIRGPQGKAADFLGKGIDDTMPAPFVKALRPLLDRVRSGRKPLLVRSIWRGTQYVTWIHPLEPSPETVPDGRLLLITRPANTDELKRYTAHRDVDVHHVEVIELGPLDVLTRRELEILALIGQGMSLPDIATLLGRSPKTVEKHREAIGRKLGANDRLALAEMAQRAGLSLADAERERI